MSLPLSGERRQDLTIMFCDLKDYTKLSESLDPEDLSDVRNAFIEACRKTVAHFEGRVPEDPHGDALVVYFGDPAHEDDAERSVRAALQIVETVPKLPTVVPLVVHIGIATGECHIDVRGFASGRTPNLAARLQKAAAAHEVLIADATRRLLGDSFELSDVSTPVKDFPELRSWRVEAIRQAAARFDAARGSAPLSALVGRAGEIGQLLDNWYLARNGAGRVVVISGDAGIGKSRLTQELRERIAGEAHIELRTQCSPYHRNAALHPVVAHMEFKARFARNDSSDEKLNKLEGIIAGTKAQRAEAAPLLASLLSLPVDRYAPLRLTAQKQKEKTLDVIIGQVEALSEGQPVLMIVEDVHWIDPTSEELIDALVARLGQLRVLLVLTYRSGPRQPAYKPHWMKSSHVRTIPLTQLEADESAELAGHVAKGKTLPPEVLKQVVERAAGLPLFVEELTKLHLESGRLLDTDRFSLAGPVSQADIPNTLKPFLIARLDQLERGKELAQIGACIGRVFSRELLLAVVSPRPEKEVDEDLEQLTRSELLFSRGVKPDVTYTFKHALVQDAAYSSLPKRERPRVHARIADELERLPASIVNQPEIIARHRTEAGQPREAIALWRNAGESALARVALQEAVNYLEKGLSLIEALPSSADRDLLEISVREPLHTARLRWRGWAAPQVGVNAAALLRLAEEHNHQRPHSLLIGLWGMWINTITQGRVAETPEWARRLLAEGDQTRNRDLQIFGHRGLVSSHFYLGELQKALDERKQILPLYRRDDAERWMELTGNDVMTAVGIFVSQALWMLGRPDEAARLSDEKDAHSRELGQPFDLGWALTWGAYVFDYRREPERLLACVGEADRLAREQAGPGRQPIPVLSNVLVPMVKGLALLRKGELPEAIHAMQLGIDGWKSAGGNLNVPYIRSAIAEALALQGDLDGGLRSIDECLEQIARPGWEERVWLPEVLRLKGWMLLRQRRLAEAEAHLCASIYWARRQQAKSWELRSSTTLAELLAANGRREAARELLSPVYNWFTEGFDTHDLKAARTLLDELR